MAVYKLSAAGGITTPRTNYSSFLAGNPKFVDTAYESIATVTVSSGVSTIDFTSIPSTFTHLQIRASVRDARTATINTLNMRVGNGSIDSGGNYSSHYLDGDGSTDTSGAAGANYTSFAFLIEPSNSAASNAFGGYIIDLLDYKNVNKYKAFRGLGGVDLNGSGNMTLASGNWMSTSAITNIQFFNNGNFNFSAYTQFALYGIKGA
jgi:hypothetical protein